MATKHKGLTGKLFSLCDAVGRAWKRCFSAEPDWEEQMYRNSFMTRSSETRQQKTFLLRMKTAFARQCEQSVLLRFFSDLLHRTLLLRARTVALFLFSYLAAAATVFVSKAVLFSIHPAPAELFFGGILLAIVLPLLFTESNLYRLLEGSVLFGGFFRYVHPSDALRDGKSTSASPGLFLVFGLLFGALTWFTGLFVLPVLLFALLFTALIFCFPEAGLLLILGIAPFLGLFDTPSVNLAVTVGFTFISLLFKILRGKKVLRFSPEGIPFVLLLAAVLLSAYSPYRGSGAAAALTAVLLLGYFLTHNLFRNEKFLSAAASAIAISASFVSLYGIAQYMLGQAPSGWMDISLFSGIAGRTVSVFDNPNVLGAYLVVSFPFVLSKITSAHGVSNRIFGIVGSVLVLVCGVLTWSRSCWIGLILGLLLFAVRLSPRGLLLLPVTALGVGTAAVCMPQSFGSRLGHMFSLSDSTNSYRVKVWNGTMRALKDFWFTGIGAGDSAFRTVYLEYAIGGAEAAPHSHSIYLQLMLSSGVFALLLFLCFTVLVLKKAVKPAEAHEPSDTPAILSAGFASVCSMLICGIFDNVFYNYRILFLFFCACGICSASAEVLRDGRVIVYNQPEAAEVTLKLRKGGK